MSILDERICGLFSTDWEEGMKVVLILEKIEDRVAEGNGLLIGR
jgi:hypothetical protein